MTDNNNNGDIIAGRNPVIEALKSEKLIDTIYISGEGGSLNLIRRLAKEKNIVVKDTQDKKLSSLCNNASHQGVVAVGAYSEYISVEELHEISRKKGTKPFIIICDEIEDPHNMSSHYSLPDRRLDKSHVWNQQVQTELLFLNVTVPQFLRLYTRHQQEL